MARKHGFFRPHVAGLSGIYSTTLREGGGEAVPPDAIEWEGDEAETYWTLEGDESGYLLLEGDEA